MHGPRRKEIEHVEAVPSRCADLLAAGEVDAGLVPVIEYHRIPGLLLVPDVCVGSRGPVRSVVLVSRRRELTELRRIALDESSRTSVALLKIIFREFVGNEPQWQTSTPNLELMLNDNDAALIIGDPGMTFARKNVTVFDLASLWRQYTGLAFVFAMWMLREDTIDRARQIDFVGARDEGLERIEEIIAYYEQRILLTRREIEEYLIDNISFRLDQNMEMGMKLFFEFAVKHSLIGERHQLKYVE